MVTEQDVLEYLTMLLRWEPGQADGWMPLIRDAAGELNRRARREPEPGDSRLICAAAALAAYRITLCDGGGEVTSFRAGEVSVTAKDAGGLMAARQRMAESFAAAAELLCDDSFAFLEV